ncbi:sensor domain-containing diguanylate cyclase [Idiomarina tyrosinivorans]|uniref:diguanylate cyclase n=1 Tax=Idiomarina tyrosinivorans TaxID=1445662 RepID=A0A432ZQ17_9GAMM|nr:sensor domain-containing diguanylate cyclase [Idiomarina tyrosinivorans]
MADQTGQKPFDQIISEISTALISSDANHTLIHIQDALATLGTYCDTDRCYVFEFAEQVTEMSNTFEWCRTGISPHMDELQNLTDHDLPWFFEQMRTHRVMIVDDVDKLPDEAGDERAEFQREAIYSVICIGMVMGEELIGFVGCDMVDRRRKWTDIDIRRIRLVGDMIANTLQRIYAHEELLNVQRRLETANQLLQSQATLDGLTGIPNRRALDERLHTELRRALRHQRSLSLMMLDIDHFKSFNDRYGHLKGDEALKCVAKILQQQCQRSTEFVARYGGEEFVIIVADTEFDQVVELGNSIVEAIEAECISHQDSDISSHLTASVGLHFERPNVDERSIDEWVQRMVESADKALYAAKMSGRNQLVSSARAAVLSTDRNRH